jgi:ATP-binding cassette subfamily B protein
MPEKSPETRTSIKEYWELLSHYLAPHRWLVAVLAFVLLASIGLQLWTPRILRDFIDMALTGGEYQAMVRTALVFFAMVLLAQVASILAAYLSQQVAWRATNSLRIDLAEHCLRMDMGFHQSHPPGLLIERVDGDVDALSQFFSQLVVQLAANALLVAGVLVLLFREDWRAGLGLTVFTLMALYTMLRVRKIGIPRWTALRQVTGEAFGFLGEILHGTEDIRSSGADGYILRRFDDMLRRWMPLRRKAMLAFSMVWTSTLLVFAAGTGFSFGLGYYLWSTGLITAGTVYLIFNYTQLIQTPIEQIRVQIQDLQRAGASVQRVRELLQAEPRIRDGTGAGFPPGALDVEFRNVSFSYGGDETALRDISFRLPAGQVLGLLGRTGSGKSTMARLLLRLYDPESGQVLLGGMEPRSARVAEISRHISLVPQEVQIFQATVRDNLSIFDASIPDDHIRQIIDEFGLSRWFGSLPRGLDTELAQGGGLSAGEAQLLNFARVALREPGLVILDEATSRLDPATEALIEHATERLLRARTGIVIAHRLHTVQKADMILILEEGCIVECGPRTALAADPGSRFSGLLRTGLEEVLG